MVVEETVEDLEEEVVEEGKMAEDGTEEMVVEEGKEDGKDVEDEEEGGEDDERKEMDESRFVPFLLSTTICSSNLG